MTTNQYLCDDETTRRRELAFGVVREPPAPFYFKANQQIRSSVLPDLQISAFEIFS